MELEELLEESKALGYLGPGPVGEHRRHAEAMASLVPPGTARLADLGAGGGVPGLVLAALLPHPQVLLIESQARRAAFLERALQAMQLQGRCSVLQARAEEVGRETGVRAACDVVVARSFGPAPVTAECGAPLLRVGGLLLVSEPPEAQAGRWPAAGLDELGLQLRGIEGDAAHFAVLEQVRACPERYPRRAGVPERRPLWVAQRST